jgi:hypothetical protein
MLQLYFQLVRGNQRQQAKKGKEKKTTTTKYRPTTQKCIESQTKRREKETRNENLKKKK